MIRIGCCTGRIYGTEYGTEYIEECCVLINGTAETNQKNIAFILEQCEHRCRCCLGCPEARRKAKRSDQICKMK